MKLCDTNLLSRVGDTATSVGNVGPYQDDVSDQRKGIEYLCISRVVRARPS